MVSQVPSYNFSDVMFIFLVHFRQETLVDPSQVDTYRKYSSEWATEHKQILRVVFLWLINYQSQ